MANKVKYGLKNVHYAVVTFASDGTPTFGSVVAIPGAVDMSLSKNGDTYEFYADDGVFFEIADNVYYEGDLELALIPDGFRTAVLNETLDAKNVMFEGADAAKVHFALLFEFTGDVNAIRHVLYNCTAQESEISGTTKGENIEVKTEKLHIVAKPLPGGGSIKAKTGATTDSTTYDGWYTNVHQYTAAQQSAGGGGGGGGT